MKHHSLKIGYLMQADAADMSEISGPRVHIEAVIKGMQRRGHQVRTVAIQRGQIQWSDDLVTWHPAKFGFSQSRSFRIMESCLRGIQSRLRLPFLRLFDSYRFADAVVSTLSDYDILYERYGLLSYGGVIAARRLGVPSVSEINGDVVEEYRQLGIRLSRVQWVVIRFITRRTFRDVSWVVASGNDHRDKAIKRWGCDTGKISVIFSGTDYDLFAGQRDRAAIRSKHHLPDGPIIAYVGGFQSWQGVDVLVQAFAEVHRQRPDAALVLVGDGPERPQVTTLAADLGLDGSVVFMGKLPLDAVADVLAASDLAAAPYRDWGETTGMKLMDYMAAGKPIVVSAHGGQHALLQDMQTALLVKPGDEAQLAGALLRLLNDEDLRQRLGQAAQAQSRKRHTWGHTAGEIEALCLKLVERS